MIGSDPLPTLQATKKPRDDDHWSQEHPQKIPDILHEVGPMKIGRLTPKGKETIVSPASIFGGKLSFRKGRVTFCH